jgi:hypothetical protein
VNETRRAVAGTVLTCGFELGHMQSFMVPKSGTILSSQRTVEASNTGELAMPPILSDLVLFSLVAAFYTGIVIALASLLT